MRISFECPEEAVNFLRCLVADGKIASVGEAIRLALAAWVPLHANDKAAKYIRSRLLLVAERRSASRLMEAYRRKREQ